MMAPMDPRRKKRLGEKRARRRRRPSSRCGCGGVEVGEAGGGSGRDWSGLPGPALFCILKYMARRSRVADLRAFACVCRAWGSSVFSGTGREPAVASYLPPFLVTYSGIRRLQEGDPSLGLYSLPDGRCSRRKVVQMPPVLLGEEVDIVGYSCGYLVVTCPREPGSEEHRHRLFLVDPLADGSEAAAHVEVPRAPFPIDQALMTAPPTSGKDCVVVALCNICIQYCRPGGEGDDAEWGAILLPSVQFFPERLVLIGKKVYVLLRTGNVLVLGGFSPPCPPSMSTLIEAKGLLRHPGVLPPSLVAELNGEMLILFEKRKVLQFAGGTMADLGEDMGAAGHGRYLVYRLDLSRWEWVRMDSLGDYSLFVSGYTGHGMASNAAKWGGSRNCIYSLRRTDSTSKKVVRIDHMEGGMVEHHPKPVKHAGLLSRSFWMLPTL